MTEPTVTRDPDLDPQLLQVLQMMDAAPAKPIYEGTAEEARASNRFSTVDLRDPASVPDLAAVENIAVAGGVGDLPARVYRPSPGGARPTIIYFHGGGFVIGDLDTVEVTCRTMALLCDAVVISVDYRLAPEHPAPAAAQDAVAAACWVSDHLAELGGDDVLAVAGESAGANLAAVVAQAFRDQGRPLTGQLLFYPLTDLAGLHGYPSMAENAYGYLIDKPTVEWFTEQYVGHLGGTGLDDPMLSPLHGDVTGVAPAVLATARFDPLRDQGRAYADKLTGAGVSVQVFTYPTLVHSFVDLIAMSSAARAATEETLQAFRELLHGRGGNVSSVDGVVDRADRDETSGDF